MLAIICVSGTVSCTQKADQEELSMGDAQPLTKFGDVPNEIPTLNRVEVKYVTTTSTGYPQQNNARSIAMEHDPLRKSKHSTYP